MRICCQMKKRCCRVDCPQVTGKVAQCGEPGENWIELPTQFFWYSEVPGRKINCPASSLLPRIHLVKKTLRAGDSIISSKLSAMALRTTLKCERI